MKLKQLGLFLLLIISIATTMYASKTEINKNPVSPKLPLEQEKRPLSSVNSNSTPSTQNRTYLSPDVIVFCKTAGLCFLASGIAACVVTVSVLFTNC